ncbi:hypothetical protein U1Q18_019924 [Sarracenia purpurea var. burkii]
MEEGLEVVVVLEEGLEMVVVNLREEVVMVVDMEGGREVVVPVEDEIIPRQHLSNQTAQLLSEKSIILCHGRQNNMEVDRDMEVRSDKGKRKRGTKLRKRWH